MNVYIPTNEDVPRKNIESLERFGHNVILYRKFYSHNRYKDVGNKRMDIVKIAHLNTDEFIAMSDSDVFHYRDNISDMANFLRENPDWGGITVAETTRFGCEARHVSLHSCMFRKCLPLNFIPEKKDCECLAVAKSLRPKWRFGCLPEVNRILHKKES